MKLFPEAALRGILWDMDGVLIDTGDIHYRVWAETMAQMGITLAPQMFYDAFGMDNAQVLRLWLGHDLPPTAIKVLSERKEALFREAIHGQVQPLPGVVDWLKKLQNLGYKQAIASSAPEKNVIMLIEELGIGSYFETMVSSQGLPGKPDPAIFLNAAQRLGLAPEECLVFEDATVGVEAARRAGMHIVALTKTHPRTALKGADQIFDALTDLPPDAFG